MIACLMFSCGNDAQIKDDAKRLVELQCKAKESFDKIMAINNQLQERVGSSMNDPVAMQKVLEDQKKYLDEIKVLQGEESKLVEEFKVLEGEMKTKYNSEKDKEKMRIELAAQLAQSGCK